MKYKYVKNALCDGWGCCGVWPEKLVDNAKIEKRYGKEFLVLNSFDMIVGRGMGWDGEAVIDEDWYEKACEAMNGRQK